MRTDSRVDDRVTSQYPRVSVIVPVRNCREFIHEAIASICQQDYQNLEVIVVDDGSTDYDYRLLAEIDSRIRVIRLSGNGVSVARNAGMRNASGDYIAFLDADDVWFPGKLTAQLRYFKAHPDVGCVFGGFIRWQPEPGGNFPPAASLMSDCSACTTCETARSGWIYTRLLTGLLVGMNTAVIRRSVFDQMGGFDESMRIGEDYLFWLKVSRVYEMHALDCSVALYRIHGSSAMSQVSDDNHQAILLSTAVSRWGLANPDGTSLSLPDYNRHVAKSEFTHGYKHFWHGDAAIARRAFRRAFSGRFMPFRSAAYYLATFVRGLVRAQRT